MPNPYPAEFANLGAEQERRRLTGQVTFTDPMNQPGAGSGGVNSVTAGDSSIIVAGTPIDPTVAVSALGIVTGKIANLAVTAGKLALKAVGAAQMDSGAATAGQVPTADGAGNVAYADLPIESVSAGDASIVVGGTSAAPTIETADLATIAALHPASGAVAMNSKKITGLADGAAASDAAAFGQIPTALPPNGSAGGDLGGTYPNPAVEAIQGVAVSGTSPSTGQVLTAADATHAAWASPSAGGSREIGYAQITAPVNITDTAEATATAIITLGPLAYDGSAVLIEAFGIVVMDTGVATHTLQLTLFEGATEITRLAQVRSVSTAFNNIETVHAVYRFSPGAGNHTYKLCAFVSATTGTPKIDAGAGGTAGSPPAFLRASYA